MPEKAGSKRKRESNGDSREAKVKPDLESVDPEKLKAEKVTCPSVENLVRFSPRNDILRYKLPIVSPKQYLFAFYIFMCNYF
jgi:hypothetical protein